MQLLRVSLARMSLYSLTLANAVSGAKPSNAALVPAMPPAQILKKLRLVICIYLSSFIGSIAKLCKITILTAAYLTEVNKLGFSNAFFKFCLKTFRDESLYPPVFRAAIIIYSLIKTVVKAQRKIILISAAKVRRIGIGYLFTA
ncbi:hypothetical protein [Pantoea piersonii]|uniref:hypothetical protein n=1 Tax=Pantoea piersonii TaxID=2364647 RepID=UPI002899FAC6|nr:hypothetical protein [Pantoea piersonii]